MLFPTYVSSRSFLYRGNLKPFYIQVRIEKKVCVHETKKTEVPKKW